ncbi:trypsin-like [Episyrphus balteatus]|uniref:trypsin-like n=1 Tax=Episyrphus balteatus TaxID=286459 RepID=UPI002485CB39|nr:trypsin-like [Episyrphus balteatus]
MFRQAVVIFVLFGCTLAGLIEPRYKPDDFGGRIVGGEPTTIEKFPYQVSLQKGGSHFCGGSLYSPNIIVTAAHCLQSVKPKEIKVRLGSANYQSGGEYVSVRSLKYHEGYDSSIMTNDVAVIRLDTPVRYSNRIQPIKLATTNPRTGAPAVVSGWGTEKFLVGSIQKILQQVQVDIVSMADCSSTKYKYGSQVRETMVCANVEGGGKDACQGDSGGPLVSEGKLVGIVSWGNMCARKDYPGVYSSVADLRSWIEKNAAELNEQ